MTTRIYIWTASLTCSPRERENYQALLSADERSREHRLLRDEAKRRFTVSRGLMRLALGRMLGDDPASIDLCYGYNGKPELAHATGLQFNVSHSRDRWYLAATDSCKIGVDVERIRPDFATLDIAERFFSPREYAELVGVPEVERAAAFFRCWTRKEAFIKAIGAGLGFPLHEFDVSLSAGSAELRAIKGSSDAAQHWRMDELVAPDGYCASLAVEGPTGDVKYEFISAEDLRP
jgi:4'-phosphopantetheinyl transferase